MAVLGSLSVTLEVPDTRPGVQFYTDAGLIVSIEGDVARFRCAGQDRDSIVLRGGALRKRLHHVSLRANDLDGISRRVLVCGGKMRDAPAGFGSEGLWVEDPHGMLIHLVDRPTDPEQQARRPFEINAPGRLVRKGISAMQPIGSLRPVQPLRLGHILVFSPNVSKSVNFATEALGMGLADRAQDVVAFCCARQGSDHHIFAFAKSLGVGYHHASFEVWDPDEVGRGGRALLAKARRGDWGFGRHTIGSNFFHYIQDPWGSWFEYFSDIDYIEDYSRWSPTNYGLEDALSNWGPTMAHDFTHNYELDEEPFELSRGAV
jgi:catechol 2,3-dioxygenase-like lactoylglutathione lyase family enzyme